MLLETEPEFNSKITVSLLGKQYTLKGDIEPEQILRISKYVDQRFFELKKRIPNVDVNGLLLLTALNLTDELLQARQEHEMLDKKELSEMYEKAEQLIRMLEEGIIGEETCH